MARAPSRTGWRRALIACLMLPVIATLGAAWFAGTEAALRWLAARAVAESAGHLTIEEVHGSLYGPLRIARLTYVDGDLRIEARTLELDWSPRELLLGRSLRVSRLSAQKLEVNAGTAKKPPPQIPPTLRLPLNLEVPNATIDALVIATGGNRHELRGLALSLDAANGRLHAKATALTPWGDAETDLRLNDTAPYALEGRAALVRTDGPVAYRIAATLAGTLAEFALSASAESRGATAELKAAITPFAPAVLKEATLRIAGIDARQFEAGLPRTELGADLTLSAQDGGGLAGALRVANGRPGSLDAALLPLREAKAQFSGTPDGLHLEKLSLDLGVAGRFDGEGSVGNEGLKLSLRTGGFDLRGMYAKLAATKLAGALTLAANANTQSAQADLRDGPYRVKFDAARRDDTVDVRSAHVAIGEGVLDLSGTLSLAAARAFRAEGTLSRFDPSLLGDYPAARINAAFSANGRLSPGPEVALEFTVSDSRYRGSHLHGKGKANVSRARLREADVALELGANRLALRGAFGVPGDALDWQLDADNLAALAAHFSGRLRASGRLEGSVEKPSGRFRAKALGLVWGKDQRIAELTAEGHIDAGLDGPLALDATLRDLRAGEVRIATGSVSAKGRLAAHEIRLAARGDGLDAQAKLEGAWGANRWSGRLQNLENRGRYALALESPANLSIGSAGFTLGAAALRTAAGTLRIDELATRGAHVVSAGQLSDIDAGYLLGLARRPLEVSSTLILSGAWKLAVTDTLNGELTLRRERGDLTLHSEPAMATGLSRLALSANATDGRLSVALEAAGDLLGTVSARGSATLARKGSAFGLPGDAPLSFDATLDLPSLAWASRLTGGAMTIDGRIRGSVQGSGTPASPHLAGSLTLTGFRFTYPEQGIYLNDGNLQARLEDRRLVFERIALRGGAGTLEGSGSMAWDAGKPQIHVALNASKLELLRTLDRHLILSGQLGADVVDQNVQLQAKLKVDEGEIVLPAADTPTLSSDVVVLGRNEKGQKKDRSFAPDAKLDLDLGEKFHLKGRGIDARLTGALTLSTTAGAAAKAIGSIRVAEGRYSAYGQRLEIERGILSFSGPLDDPGLNIVAMRKLQPVEAGVSIRGSALAPKISLVSNPTVPDSEKLSLLILGHGASGSNRTDLALLQTAATALLSRGDSVMLTDRIAQATGLDDVSVSGSGGLESTVLNLGKRLSSRAYLSFEQGLAAATSLVKINYTLTPRLSVRAQTGTESAVDAFYTFRFK